MAEIKLGLVPSGYKSTKVYSIVPNDGSGDFTFARASAAVKVNVDNELEEEVAGMPRLDYSNSNNPMLLLERQAENAIRYSNDFSNGWWYREEIDVLGTMTKVNTIYMNDIISPDGSLNGIGIVSENLNNTAHDHRNIQGSPVTLDQYYTVSLYAKYGNSKYLSYYTQKGQTGNTFVATFDLEQGAIVWDGFSDQATGEGSRMEDAGNGWYRCITTFKAGATADAFMSPIITNEEFTNNSFPNFVGDGSKSYVYGYQFEAGRLATSYIDTQNSYVTRSADSCTASAPTLNASEGTIYINFVNQDVAEYDQDEVFISLGNSTSDKIFFRRDSGTDTYTFGICNGGVDDLLMSGLSIQQGEAKVALQYKDEAFKVFINGVEAQTDNSSVTIPTLSVVHLNDFNLNHPNLQLLELRVYDEAIGSLEAVALTQ